MERWPRGVARAGSDELGGHSGLGVPPEPVARAPAVVAADAGLAGGFLRLPVLAAGARGERTGSRAAPVPSGGLVLLRVGVLDLREHGRQRMDGPERGAAVPAYPLPGGLSLRGRHDSGRGRAQKGVVRLVGVRAGPGGVGDPAYAQPGWVGVGWAIVRVG